MKVIILDGNQRSALAVTRSLGKKGINVTVGAETNRSIASCSKYCYRSFCYPSPYKNPHGFIQSILEGIGNHHEAILIPITDVTVGEILKQRDLFMENVRIPFVGYNEYLIASDKVTLFRVAEKLTVPIPKTLFSAEFKDRGGLIEEGKKLGFPLVVKPFSSRIRGKDGWVNGGVRYANHGGELKDILDNEPFRSYPFIVQERIEGPGMGVFLLMREGEVLARFAHRRMREKPPSGGVSVLCESIELPPVALDAAEKLLKKLNWSGVGMVEFKEDSQDNIPKLMEVNARFWGSLQLAISAGVDFPYLLYCLANGEKINPPSHYKVGERLRWELGDLDYLLIRLKKRSSELFLQSSAPSRFHALVDFVVDFFRPSIRNEVLRFDDPVPFLFELKQYIKDILS